MRKLRRQKEEMNEWQTVKTYQQKLIKLLLSSQRRIKRRKCERKTTHPDHDCTRVKETQAKRNDTALVATILCKGFCTGWEAVPSIIYPPDVETRKFIA